MWSITLKVLSIFILAIYVVSPPAPVEHFHVFNFTGPVLDAARFVSLFTYYLYKVFGVSSFLIPVLLFAYPSRKSKKSLWLFKVIFIAAILIVPYVSYLNLVLDLNLPYPGGLIGQKILNGLNHRIGWFVHILFLAPIVYAGLRITNTNPWEICKQGIAAARGAWNKWREPRLQPNGSLGSAKGPKAADMGAPVSVTSIAANDQFAGLETPAGQALAALLSLGYKKQKAREVLKGLLQQNPQAGSEELIRNSLRKL